MKKFLVLDLIFLFHYVMTLDNTCPAKNYLERAEENLIHIRRKHKGPQTILLFRQKKNCKKLIPTVYFLNNKQYNPKYKAKKYEKYPKTFNNKDDFIFYYKPKEKGIVNTVLNNAGLFKTLEPSKANLIWLTCKPWNEYKDYVFFPKKLQKINKLHLMDNFDLMNIYKQLEKMKQNNSNNDTLKNKYNFLPKAFILPKNKAEAFKYFSNKTESRLWILKKTDKKNADNDIKFIQTVDDIPDNGLIVKYIKNPLLFNNRKFTTTVFALVTGVDPIKIYLYQDGYVTFASESFSVRQEFLKNKFAHSTKIEDNINHKKFQKSDKFFEPSDSFRNIKNLFSFFEKRQVKTKQIWKKIKEATIKTILLFVNKELKLVKDNTLNLHNNNYFQIVSLDFLIENEEKTWLIGVSKCPELFNVHNATKIIGAQIVKDALNIVGISPFRHTFDEDVPSKTSPEELADDARCEFSRPHGLFEKIFPKKQNIGLYRKYIEETESNKILWEKMIG